MRKLLPILLLAATGVQAAPSTPLQPLAFLAGHCWKGVFADGKTHG
jgi:hypothetical protein